MLVAILLLLILGLITLFVLQNTLPVTVSFFFLEIRSLSRNSYIHLCDSRNDFCAGPYFCWKV